MTEFRPTQNERVLAFLRAGIGVELKPSYFRQAVKNMAALAHDHDELSWTDHSETEDESWVEQPG